MLFRDLSGPAELAKMSSHMVPECGLLSPCSARLSSKVRGGRYHLFSKIYGFFRIRNHAFRNGQKCLKLSKSTLGQVKLSVEVQYVTLEQFLDFLEGLFSVSAHWAPPPLLVRGAWVKC